MSYFVPVAEALEPFGIQRGGHPAAMRSFLRIALLPVGDTLNQRLHGEYAQEFHAYRRDEDPNSSLSAAGARFAASDVGQKIVDTAIEHVGADIAYLAASDTDSAPGAISIMRAAQLIRVDQSTITRARRAVRLAPAGESAVDALSFFKALVWGFPEGYAPQNCRELPPL